MATAHISVAMKLIYKTTYIIVPLIILLLVVIVNDDQEVLIESEESKTVAGGPVFNKIKWFQFKNKDVWMMNQSHHGKDAKIQEWDRLAIVIDKTTTPKVAKFYQLSPGPLKWGPNQQSKPFKVSCYMCHSNGPRIIRPNYNSLLNQTSLLESLKISYWNFRIKLYGKVIPHSSHKQEDVGLKIPFRWRSKYENEVLQIKTCMHCHKEKGFLARGTLKRQQMPTIKFMLERGYMPPLGFSLTSEEKKQIQQFLKGF